MRTGDALSKRCNDGETEDSLATRTTIIRLYCLALSEPMRTISKATSIRDEATGRCRVRRRFPGEIGEKIRTGQRRDCQRSAHARPGRRMAGEKRVPRATVMLTLMT